MKYVKQFGIILGVTCIGEGMKYLMPFPIPGSIYGLLLLLTLLLLGIVKPAQVENAGEFLIEIMPLMFIPAAVGLMVSWKLIKGMLVPLCVIVLVSTCLVMVVTGKVTDYMIKKKEQKHE